MKDVIDLGNKLDYFYFERMNQNDGKYQFLSSPTIKRTKNSYTIYDDEGKVASKLNFYDYTNIQNFDWILVSDLDTKEKYRNRGLASKLLKTLYHDITKTKNKGLYMFVKVDNNSAIKLYLKLGFKKLKNYKIKDEKYVIMVKGDYDTSQFDNMNFS